MLWLTDENMKFKKQDNAPKSEKKKRKKERKKR